MTYHAKQFPTKQSRAFNQRGKLHEIASSHNSPVGRIMLLAMTAL